MSALAVSLSRRISGAYRSLSSVDGRRFFLPTGRSSVHIDDSKNAKCTVGDANVSFCQMQCNIRHELRGWNAAADLATNLHQNFLDAATEKRLSNNRLSLFVKQPALCIRNVHPHLVRRSGVRKIGLHEFVDASLVHISQVYQLDSMTAAPLSQEHAPRCRQHSYYVAACQTIHLKNAMNH